MPVLASALTYRRLVADNAAVRLLRADLMPVAAAVLGEHLGTPGARMAADELHERLEAELDELRDHFDLGAKSAKAYCDDWRAAGLLVRRPSEQSRGETYELSPDARDALRILDQLESPQSTVTESRLVALMTALHRLAVDTDTNVTHRVAALREERDRIDSAMERLNAGEIDVLDDRRATERMSDVLLQAQNLPADFARVRTRFEELNQELRASVLAEDNLQSTVLDDIFRGVDLIESSDEGHTFSAFSSLLRDSEQSARLDEDVAEILDRDFAHQLSTESRRTMRGLVRDLKRGSREVHGVLTDFARGLRRYVHSQEFHKDRALRAARQGALSAAIPVSRSTRPYTEVGLELELSAMSLRSVGEILPYDPAEFDAGPSLPDAEEQVIDLAALKELARETEIDFAELAHNVNAVLKEQDVASVAQVLQRHPATQGLASVVGLLSLATRFGEVRTDETEQLHWTGSTDGRLRTAVLPCHVFTREVAA